MVLVRFKGSFHHIQGVELPEAQDHETAEVYAEEDAEGGQGAETRLHPQPLHQVLPQVIHL